MVELLEQHEKHFDRQSSKGNQLKWEKNGIWYKADYAGYEGLAEYVVSHLLFHSNLSENEYVKYDIEQIKYKNIYTGVKSLNFVEDDWQIITLERLFKLKYGQSLHSAIWHIHNVDERFTFLANSIRTITGLDDFDKYLNKLFTIDAFFLNEDRHTHNIAVMMNSREEFRYCKIFDNGASLLSDTTLDYPLGDNISKLISECHAKTIHDSFDEQLDTSEKICGINLKLNFTKNEVEELVMNAPFYSDEIKERVANIIFNQMHKYQYLFV